jgi:phenylpropionate dioxygenase-like ring-hydroxylating dioxygenase large terminal subunit
VVGVIDGSRKTMMEPMGASRRVPMPRACSYEPGDWAILARHWFPIARLADLGEAPLAATLLDVRLVVFRTTAGIRVARDLCPHRGVPLSMGWVEGEEIVCAYHGLRFGPNGRCRKIPAQPNVEPSALFAATMLPAVERYGLIWTCLDPTDNEADIPPFDLWDDAGYQQIVPPVVDIAAAPGRQVEGFVDVAHFAWIHHEAFADRGNPIVPLYKTRTTDRGLQTEYRSNVSNYPKALQHLEPPGFEWLRVFDIYPPFTATLTVHFPGTDRLHIMNAASPVSARKTRLFVPLLRNFDTTGPVEEVYAFNAQIFAEDQAIVEAQHPEDLPLDLESEAHFAADRTAVGYRKLLKAMGLSLQQAG